MCKKIYKFYNRISKKQFFNLLSLCGILGICSVLLLVAKLIAPFLVKTDYFSSYSTKWLASDIFGIFLLLLIIAVLAFGICIAIGEKRVKKQLENRKLSEYLKKYLKYVDLVDNSLKAEEYKTVSLPYEWVKQFDKHLSYTSSCCGSTRDFTDFEVAACLIFALDDYDVSIDFAFHCAKLIITKPNIYHRKYLDGDELCFEASETMDEACFPDLDESKLSFILSLLKTYLTQRDSYYEVLKLADFLRILYLSCTQ